MSCAGDPAAGAFGKLLIEPGAAAHTFDADSLRFDFLHPETMQKHGRLIGGQGIWGGLYPLSTRTRTGHYFCYGELRFQPSPGMLQSLLTYLVGTKETTPDIFYPSDCPNKFGLLIYRDLEDGDTKSFEYKTCEVSYWELESRAPNFRDGEGVDENAPDVLTLTVGVIATDEAFTAWPATEPALPEGVTYYPHALHDGTFTIGGGTRSVRGFKLRYDNNRIPIYANSLAAIGFAPTKAGRRITLDVHLPWDANTDSLYDMAYTGEVASINLVNGLYGTEFEIANFKVPPESPYIIDHGPVHFTIRGQAFGLAANSATTKEFKVTNDITGA